MAKETCCCCLSVADQCDAATCTCDWVDMRHAIYVAALAAAKHAHKQQRIAAAMRAALTIVSGQGAMPADGRVRAVEFALAALAGVPAALAGGVGGSVTRHGPANVDGKSRARR
jgi:hypothetical protein